MNLRWLLKMSLWARRPPSERRVKFVLAILGVCLVLAAVEWLLGWPEWLTVSSSPRGRLGF